MNIYHDPEIDFLSINFTDEIETRSVYEDGIIIRYNKNNNVIGIDITDSSKFFETNELMTLSEACKFLNISESTLRRRIRANKIKYVKNGKFYRFKKSDIINHAA